MRLNRIKFMFAVIFLMSACAQRDQDNKRLEEVADIQAQQDAKAQQEALNKKSIMMEKDLQRRYRFYSSVAYKYEGQIKIDGTDYGILFQSQPTIPLYNGDRIRTVEEVSEDLNNLGLNASFKFWNIKKPESTTGCQFPSTKAFYENGSFQLRNETTCGNIFNVYLSNSLVTSKELPEVFQKNSVEANAVTLSQMILSGQKSTADFLTVQMTSLSTNNSQNFQLKRK